MTQLDTGRQPSGASRPTPATRWQRPGQVVAVEGIVFQCDADDPISGLVIRPVQQLSRRLRGRGRGDGAAVPLANHAGIRVRIARPGGGASTYVVEQLTGTARQHFVNGLSWTPWREFRARQAGGWDVTVPATAFAGVDRAAVAAAVAALNDLEGHPFYGEVCTAVIERVFGGRRLFEPVEVLDRLVPGPGPRIPEPAAPLFKPGARLSKRARQLLRVDDLATAYGGGRARAAGPGGAALARKAAARRLHWRRPTPGAVWFWLVAQVGRRWPRPRAT